MVSLEVTMQAFILHLMLLLLDRPFLMERFFRYSKADVDRLINNLGNIDWHKVIDGKSKDDAWCTFRYTFLSCIHKYVASRKAVRSPKSLGLL